MSTMSNLPLDDSIKPVILVGPLEGNFLASFLLGWTVTTSAGLASYPLDTIRRRMMMTSGGTVHYKSMFDAGSQIIAKEGIKSLFKGAGANILRGVAGAGVLSLYDKAQELMFGKVYSVSELSDFYCVPLTFAKGWLWINDRLNRECIQSSLISPRTYRTYIPLKPLPFAFIHSTIPSALIILMSSLFLSLGFHCGASVEVWDALDLAKLTWTRIKKKAEIELYTTLESEKHCIINYTSQFLQSNRSQAGPKSDRNVRPIRLLFWWCAGRCQPPSVEVVRILYLMKSK